MRVIGRMPVASYGPRGPTAQEVALADGITSSMPRVVPKGVHRFRSHDEANRASDRWVVDGVVARAGQLARGEDVLAPRDRD